MVRITLIRLMPPDDPMFSNGVEMLSPLGSKRSMPISPSDTAGAIPDEDLKDDFLDPMVPMFKRP